MGTERVTGSAKCYWYLNWHYIPGVNTGPNDLSGGAELCSQQVCRWLKQECLICHTLVPLSRRTSASCERGCQELHGVQQGVLCPTFGTEKTPCTRTGKANRWKADLQKRIWGSSWTPLECEAITKASGILGCISRHVPIRARFFPSTQQWWGQHQVFVSSSQLHSTRGVWSYWRNSSKGSSKGMKRLGHLSCMKRSVAA